MTRPSDFPFPVVRKLSALLTPWLLRTPISANQLTTMSLLFGLSAASLYATGDASHEVLAAVAFVLCYVLDNCDGEVARQKQQTSEFGAIYDTLVDWIVHAVFFVGLGAGRAMQTGNALWLWLGVAAGAGGTINYFLGLYLDSRESEPVPEPQAPQPRTPGDWLVFGFRELARADFCFIVLLLAFFHLTWILLPAAALGAQVYWVMQFSRAARRFHV